MEPRPQRKIIIERREKSWLIYLVRHVHSNALKSGWQPVEQLLRGPISWATGSLIEEPEFKVRGLAEQIKRRRDIFEPVEVRAEISLQDRMAEEVRV